MITQILNDWFDDSKIVDEDRINYVVLCDYFNEDKTFKNKHLKKLKKRLKKEIAKETK